MTDDRNPTLGVLDAAVPRAEQHGDWDRVVADATGSTRQRTWTPRVAALAAVVAVAAAGILLSPFGGDSPTFLERAQAAVGEGSVLHLKLRGDWGPTLVDLESGRPAPVHADTEVWYDESRGLHAITYLGGVPQENWFRPADRVTAAEREQYAGFATRYREALSSGRAHIVGTGAVAGRSVRWIQVHGEWLPDVADGRDHLFAHEVGVDSETFQPVFFRTTRDRKPPPGPGNLITVLEFELLPAGEGDFTAPAAPPGGRQGPFMMGRGDKLTPEQAASGLGGRTLWLGRSFAGVPLDSIWVLKHGVRDDDRWRTTRGLVFLYGDTEAPDVLVELMPELTPAWLRAPVGIELPDAKMLIERGSRSRGFLRANGLYVGLQARSREELLDAARALRPMR